MAEKAATASKGGPPHREVDITVRKL